MYEFDEDGWDEQEAETDELKEVVEGWLIQLAHAHCGGDSDPRISMDRSNLGARPESDQPMFLQIGTGQWCGAEYATLFPRHSTAVVYAKEFGYVVGMSVQIVKHRF